MSFNGLTLWVILLQTRTVDLKMKQLNRLWIHAAVNLSETEGFAE
jgi:hypothetical protein